jgi:hypothetical protein
MTNFNASINVKAMINRFKLKAATAFQRDISFKKTDALDMKEIGLHIVNVKNKARLERPITLTGSISTKLAASDKAHFEINKQLNKANNVAVLSGSGYENVSAFSNSSALSRNFVQINDCIYSIPARVDRQKYIDQMQSDLRLIQDDCKYC